MAGSNENLIDDKVSLNIMILLMFILDSSFQPPTRVISSGSATLGRKPSSGIPKWSASPGKESLGGELMTRSTLSRQCVSSRDQ